MTIKAGVGISDNISGIEAIKEAIDKSLKKSGDKNPKLAIILTSINYENELGKILSAAKKILPKTKVVGGTGAAVLSSEGVYVRGIGVMTISGDLDIGIGMEKVQELHQKLQEKLQWNKQ
jgi:hypothetical protein